MLDDYKELQPLFYKYINKILFKNRISHAYIIETNNVSYGFDIAKALSKSFLCPSNYLNNNECENCQICHTIDNNNYPDIKIIESNSVIKKEQVLDLEQTFSVKPLYGKYLIYIIKDANMLNKSSENTILKFLEEPSPNIIAILLTNNSYNLLPTIVSRCQILSLLPENNLNNSLFLKYFDQNRGIFKDFINSKTLEIINFYVDLETFKTKIIAISNPYIFKDCIDLLLTVGLNLYMDVLNKKINRELCFYSNNLLEIEKISKCNQVDDIIYKIKIIDNFIKKNNNINKELFIDNFIISFVGGNND